MQNAAGLPVISGKECVRALIKAGFYIRRRKPSHIIMGRDVPFVQTVVPDHTTIDRGTPRVIIKEAGLTVEEFNKYLDR
ncbi:MAG: type II toxin-antitoxin system HicA family toxin [Candidatus Aenigmarchaeota archaeon]|nr:type II toxin-antitoxin system HicA family toxin [Candidatus Aenigmarchaeota archaeon]